MRTQKLRNLLTAAVLAPLACVPSLAQNHRPMDAASSSVQPARRTRLILKDGTYQLVMRYTIDGKIVRFWSAERDGEQEQIPLDLVDLPATEAWQQAHTPGPDGKLPAPVLSPELAREEAERAARSPEVAKNLRLPDEDAVVVMDTFRGAPEIVPLPQQGTDLNKETAHAELKVDINPASSPHRIGDIPGERADVQLHVEAPVFFIRVGKDDAENTSGGAITVDTHGESGRATPGTGSDRSDYVIERVDVRQGLRQLDSFRIAQLGTHQPQRDIIECKVELLPGGHWLRVTPLEPLLFGEYALIEILGDRSVNLAVWDFGVHSDAKENTEALRPETRAPASLQRR